MRCRQRAARRHDGASQFQPQLAIAPDGSQFIGDYQGLTADDSIVHPVWKDSRSRRQEMYTAVLPSAHA